MKACFVANLCKIFYSEAMDMPVTVADREAVLGITDVALWIDDFSPDTSKESLKKTSGLSFGNVFVGRKGKRVFMITVSGIYFDESAEISDLLGEKWRALERLPAP